MKIKKQWMESTEPALPGRAVPVVSGERGQSPRGKKMMAVGSFLASMGITALAFAAETTAAAAGSAEGHGSGVGLLGVVIGMAIASLGGALGQGKVGAAALEGIARNPGAASKVQTPMILALALIESLVLLTFLMAYMAQGKIH